MSSISGGSRVVRWTREVLLPIELSSLEVPCIRISLSTRGCRLERFRRTTATFGGENLGAVLLGYGKTFLEKSPIA